MEGYVPDSNLARELNTGRRAGGVGRNCIRSPQLHRLRRKLRSPTGRATYAIVEPVLGSLKEQRGMKRFRLQGLQKVAIEFTMATIAFNLTRIARMG